MEDVFFADAEVISETATSQTIPSEPNIETPHRADVRRGASGLDPWPGMEAMLATQVRMEDMLGQLHRSCRHLERSVKDMHQDVRSVCSYRSQEEEGTRPEHPGDTRTSRPRVSLVSCMGSSSAATGRRHSVYGFTSNSQKMADVVATGSSATAAASDFVAPTLPLGWPQSLKMRREYTLVRLESTGVTRMTRKSILAEPLLEEGQASEASRGRMIYLRDPNSFFHVVFDFVVMLVLIYDLTVVPYQIAWDLDTSGFFNWVTVTCCFFWTMDICLSFWRGYYRDGELVTEQRRISRHYLRTWFFPDMMIVTSDWVNIALLQIYGSSAGSQDSLKMLRLIKVSKVLRLLGTLRVFRVARLLESLAEKFMSQTFRLIMRICTLFVLVLWINHMICCAWFLIGAYAPSDTGNQWTMVTYTTQDGEVVKFTDASLSYQYVTSLHWAMAQSTLGSMEINPSSTLERLFNVLCLLLGLLFGSTLISSLSATMVEAQMLGRDRHAKLDKLRRYLCENPVDRQVALRVFRQAVDRIGFAQRLPAEDVTVLRMLSPALQQELHMDICKTHLDKHPLFRTWHSMDAAWIRAFCASAATMLVVPDQDELFEPGMMGDAAFYLISGGCAYFQEPATSAVDEEVTVDVAAGQWLCEMALWTQWVHVGKLEATTSCQFLAVNADSLWESVDKHIVIKALAMEYCQVYTKQLLASMPPHSAWPTDLRVPFTDFSELVSEMDDAVRISIGNLAIAVLEQRRHFLLGRTSELERLKQQVLNGSCTLLTMESGEVVRSVVVVVLHLVARDGQVLVQLGKVEEGVMTPECVLPAVRQMKGENMDRALNRLLQRLYPLNEAVVVQSTEQTQVFMPSKEYGVQTYYTRKICNAVLSGQAGAIELEWCSLLGNVSVSSIHSLTSWAGDGDDLPEPHQHRVYYLYQQDDHSTGKLVAWMSQEMFQCMQTPRGEAHLRSWLEKINWSQSGRHSI